MGIWTRFTQGVRRTFAAPSWPRYAGADWADTVMDASITDRLFVKQGRTIARWSLTSDDRELVVFLKRHYQLSWVHALAALIWPRGNWSPGMGEKHNLEIARGLGLPVPRVAAAAEYIGPGVRLQGCIALEELTDMAPLHEAVPSAQARLSSAEFAAWKRGLTAELVRLTRLMHDKAWFHKDLYFCHFYIPNADTFVVPSTWEGRVHLIDFHRLGRHLGAFVWWRAKDLGQFLFSSDVPGVTARDRLRFWKLYCAGRDSLFLRWTRRTAEVRSRNYHRHNKSRTLPSKAA